MAVSDDLMDQVKYYLSIVKEDEAFHEAQISAICKVLDGTEGWMIPDDHEEAEKWVDKLLEKLWDLAANCGYAADVDKVMKSSNR